MRVSLNLDERLMNDAARLTGLTKKSEMVQAGSGALIARESVRRLAAMGGTQKKLRPVPRRRSKSK